MFFPTVSPSCTTRESNLAIYMIFFLKILHCMLWITSQTHFKHGFTANVIKTVRYYPTVKHGDIICDLCMNCHSTQTLLHDIRQLFADVLCCWLSCLLSTLSVLPRQGKKTLRDARFLSVRVDLMLFPEDTSNTGQTSSHHHFVWFFRSSWRLSEVSSTTPAAAPAVIESERNEVMTVSCPRPSSLDLQHEWSRLKGRVH